VLRPPGRRSSDYTVKVFWEQLKVLETLSWKSAICKSRDDLVKTSKLTAAGRTTTVV